MIQAHAELTQLKDSTLSDYAKYQIMDSARKTSKYLRDHESISCSVSGGSDSDIVIDLLESLRPCGKTINYVFFDTGIEYDATKRHLDYLEDRYGIKITRRKGKLQCPQACQKFGVPFISKTISEYIYRLQSHNFGWEDKPFDELCKKYPNCKSALKWWCNAWGEKSNFNIRNNRNLKEFIMMYPPNFRISKKCCEYGKVAVARSIQSQAETDLVVMGLRKSEGGQRATSHTSCFTQNLDKPNIFLPVFFWDDDVKSEYKTMQKIVYSDCYEVWGMKRTGCAGCPFGSRFEEELSLIDRYEPNLSRAVHHIFEKSYGYTRAYKNFKRRFCQNVTAFGRDDYEQLEIG